MGIIDHIGFAVSDIERAIAFYEKALVPLGLGLEMRLGKEITGTVEVVGFGKDGKPELWLSAGARTEPRVHVALIAESRAVVDAFHAAAITAGGRDNGPPGLRPHYHPNYYGAFVLDPDGHNIEAVCHGAE